MRAAPERRGVVWAWALYDWANSAFATVVMAGLFPILFQDYWSADVDAARANLRLGWANGLASAVIVVLAPLAGAMADRAGRRKQALLGFALPAAGLTMALAWVPAGDSVLAATLFSLAVIGFMAANLFYDALLVGIAPPARWHAISGLGFGVGYLGGGLVYLACVLAILHPAMPGFASATEAALGAFIVTGLWWTVFALPLAFQVPEPPREGGGAAGLAGGLRQLRATLSHLRAYRPVWLFLLAYFLYIDGVGTTIRMAVAYGRSLGFAQTDLMLALLITQFVGFPAALLMGRVGERLGARRGILMGLALYIGIALWGAFIQAAWEFYAIAALVGVAQGGVQALSRSFYAGLIPAERAGEFFGFYNVLGKSAALIGPPLFGALGVWLGDVRYSMIALVALFLGGGLILSRIRSKEDAPR